MASPVVASSTDDATIRSAIDSAATRGRGQGQRIFGPDEDRQMNKHPAGSRAVAGGKRTTTVAFFGTAWGGGLNEKENEANEWRGADVLVMSSSSLLS